jgi:two-component system sensor histidine kinase AgrC
MSLPFIILMYCLSRMIFIWTIDAKFILNKKQCVILSILSVMNMILIICKFPINFCILFYFFTLMINFYLYKKKYGTLIAPTMVISVKYQMLIFSWFSTFDIPRILFGLKIFNSFLMMIIFHILQQSILLVFAFLVNYAISKYSILNKIIIIENKYQWICIVYLCIIVFLSYIRQVKLYPKFTEIFIMSSMLLITSFMLLLLFFLLISFKQSESIKESLFSDLEKKRHEEIEQIKNFEHDYKNILIVLSEFLQLREFEEAKTYLKELIEYPYKSSDTTNFSIYLINNVEIQTYLLSFVKQAQEKEIKCSVMVIGTPYKIKINQIDLVRIISIAASNALEECESLDDGKIDIKFYFSSEEVNILFTNTFLGNISVNSIGDKGITFKKNHSGRGLHILKNILKENHSLITIEVVENLFQLTITIPNNDEYH